ncbi:MAG: NrfD/PsrC family molybdoenzyme membrane anchor subunit [Opitutaceae bacterium]|jgi:molybdopterin-containing oxidoreductase family membrane subunit
MSNTASAALARHGTSYARFLWKAVRDATDGSAWFYAWMILLTSLALVGLHAWAVQVRDGLVVTGMSDHVSWGLYIANFTFMVGLAAGGVMMVIPAYLYHDHEMHDLTIVGELLAVAAIVMSLCFVVVDMGRPERFWHLIPGIGRFNWPFSMLTWDVIVLNGYLALNLHICGYLLYMRFLGRKPSPRWYLPFVYLSIFWAISIHTVTAFLYSGLGGRPLWNTALLAPRFLVTAFIAGPALIVVLLFVLRRLGGVPIGPKPVQVLVNIVRVTLLINLLMVASELFTELYSGGSHTASGHYLFFGLDGAHALVPWIWSAVGMGVVSALMFLRPGVVARPVWLTVACALAFAGIWIEKGMGLIVPAFIPSTLHEIVEYSPSLVEWQIMAGIWAFGLLVLTVALKIALPILRQPHGEETAATSDCVVTEQPKARATHA